MQTFVVRLFVAPDLDDLAGLLEEPMTGLRHPFSNADELLARLTAASRLEPVSAPTPERVIEVKVIAEAHERDEPPR